MEREGRIAELEAELRATDARLAEREEQLAAKDAQLAAKDARIEQLEQLVATLMEEVATLTSQVEMLTEKLGRNSSNSHLPPSSDPPGRTDRRSDSKNAKTKQKGKRKTKTKRGGQRGHQGTRRALLPAEQVDKVENLWPETCESCWARLPEVEDPKAKRYQVTEVPPIRPHTTEVRRHEVTCEQCGYKTRAPYDEGRIPASPFGPRLMALVALLTGIYHLSRRKAQTLLSDVVGVQISLGGISRIEERMSRAVGPTVDQVCDHVERAKVKHTDGTSWLQAGVAMSLWTIATATATVFKIVIDSSKATLEPLFGALRGILVSDRAKALGFWAMERRQICWAHLLRKFVSFSEREGRAGAIGRELLSYTGIVFEYWHDYKAGKLDRSTFRLWMTPVRVQMEALLAKAVAATIKRLSGSCADILAHKEALWTFVERDDVEPTNNHAERELRAL